MDRIEISSEIEALLAAGRKIDAIKVLRDEHNLGLKEAKNIIDNHIASNLHRYPKKKPQNGINALAVFIALLVILLIAYLLLT